MQNESTLSTHAQKHQLLKSKNIYSRLGLQITSLMKQNEEKKGFTNYS